MCHEIMYKGINIRNHKKLLGIFYLQELGKSDDISLSNYINNNVQEVSGGTQIKKNSRRQIYEE